MARRKRRPIIDSTPVGIPILSIIAIVVVLGGIAFSTVKVYQVKQRSAINEETLCPSTGPKGHLAILIDTTDPLTFTQVRAGRGLILDYIDKAETGTLVSFSVVSPSESLRGSSFYSICKPLPPEQATAIYQNPRLIREAYQSKFQTPVQNALDSLLSVPEAKSSPIMEALQELVASIDGFITDDTPKKLVLMSDLMQHSEVFSFYRNGTWQSFVESGSSKRIAGNLRRTEVVLLQVPRDADRNDIVEDFWVRYLEAQGVSSVRSRILGDL